MWTGSGGRRSKKAGGRGVVCRAGSAWAPSSRAAHVLYERGEFPRLLTPRPGRTSDVLCSCGRPRPLWGLALPWGSRPTLGARWETMPGARWLRLRLGLRAWSGEELRRGEPGGGRGHLSARLRRRRAGQPSTWPCRVREGPGPGLQSPRRARQGGVQLWGRGCGAEARQHREVWKVASAGLQGRELVKNTLKPKNLGAF